MNIFKKSISLSPIIHNRAAMSSLANYSFKTLLVTQPRDHVFHVELNRPKKMNAVSMEMTREIKQCFESLGSDSECRAIVFGGQGKMFCSGIDLNDLASFAGLVTADVDVARKCVSLKSTIIEFQNCVSAIEKCPKPVINAIHNGCIGAGLHLAVSADIRYSSKDAWFSLKEVDLGFAADIGALQRLPKIIGSESLVRELCFTGRKFYADEAHQSGLISRLLPDKQTVLNSALELASLIAEKSPVGVQTTKETLIHARDHSVQEGLEFIAGKNMVFLQSEDVMKAITALMNKEKAVFANL